MKKTILTIAALLLLTLTACMATPAVALPASPPPAASDPAVETAEQKLESLIQDKYLLDYRRLLIDDNAMQAMDKLVREGLSLYLELGAQNDVKPMLEALETARKLYGSIAPLETKLTDEEFEVLAAYGVDATDYLTLFDMHSYTRDEYLNDLELYSGALEIAVAGDTRLLEIMLARHEEIGKIEAEFKYTEVNYMLCGLDAQKQESFRRDVLSGFDAIIQGEQPWETDKLALEARGAEILNELEACYIQINSETGVLEDELANMQAADAEEQ